MQKYGFFKYKNYYKFYSFFPTLIMQQSKLLDFIKKIPQNELERLHDFVRSPFFNKGKDAQYHVLLFEHIKNNVLDFENSNLNKENIALTLFSTNDKAQIERLNKIMSGLTKLVEEYIIYTYSGLDKKGDFANHTKRNLILLKFYRKNELNNKFDNLLYDLQKAQEEVILKDKNFFLQQFDIEYAVLKEKSSKNKGKGNLNLPNTLKYLDWYYFVLRLELSNLLVTQNLFTATQEKEYEQFRQFVPFVESFEDGLPPIVKIALEVTKLISNSNSNTEMPIVENLIALLQQNKSELPIPFIYDIHASIRNYFTLLYNEGNLDILKELFDFQCYQLKEGYFYTDNKIKANAFLGIVNNSLKLKQYEWVKTFLEKHEFAIIGDTDNALYKFNLENYYFSTKDYAKIEYSFVYPYKDTNYLTAARRLEIKFLYEQEDFYALDFKIKAFSQFLFNNREKLSHVITDNNASFLAMVKKLILLSEKKLNTRKDDKFIAKITKLKESIKQGVVGEKEWLLDKLEEM